MNVRGRALAGLARQLGHPRGLAGRLVGRRLNRSNRQIVALPSMRSAFPRAPPAPIWASVAASV